MSRSTGVLAARSVSKSHGEVAILDRFVLTVGPRSRIGVVGPNGVGKTTMLRILAGVELPDLGRVVREPPDLIVGYLPQQTENSGRSGGEAARIQLERCLDLDADVLLLDEPTNDLDYAGLALLEQFVHRFRGGIVVVSHDRAFLETMTRIVEFEAETRRIAHYAGGWSEYARQRRSAREHHEAAYSSYVGERERIRAQARRMRQWEQQGYGQGRKKKKTKDAAKTFERKLARVEEVEKPWSAWRLQLELAPTRRGGDIVARLEQAVVARDGFRIGPIDLEVSHGERLAIVGNNGAGKTTLVKALIGELPLAAGRRWIGPGIVLGMLPQGLGPFADERSLLDAFMASSALAAGDARALLARFALGPEDVTRQGLSLSPGERSRAALALLAARHVNTLILDEPTNHLDLEAIEQLEQALGDYQGTALLITHDRRFLEAFVPTRILEVAKGIVRPGRRGPS